VVIITGGWWPSPSFAVAVVAGVTVVLLPSLAEEGGGGHHCRTGRWLVQLATIVQSGSWLMKFAVEGAAWCGIANR